VNVKEEFVKVRCALEEGEKLSFVDVFVNEGGIEVHEAPRGVLGVLGVTEDVDREGFRGFKVSKDYQVNEVHRVFKGCKGLKVYKDHRVFKGYKGFKVNVENQVSKDQ